MSDGPGARAGTDWNTLRYDRLLRMAARSLRRGAVYAAVVARVEWRRDPWRRAAATARIARWLGAGPAQAARVYRRSLASEAREEADAAFFMTHPAAFAGAFPTPPVPPPADGSTIHVSLHLGSPVLGYLALCRTVPDLALVARALGPDNPLPPAKHRFAVRKVAWTEATAGRPFFATDAAAMLKVRTHLRAGRPLYALVDVPGDAVGRSATCTLFGEAVRLAAGLPTLARVAGSAVQTHVTVRTARGWTIDAGPRLAAGTDLPAVLDALAPFIRAYADQWWMWPYLPPAIDSSER